MFFKSTPSKKPLEEQINDLKVAGATLLTKLDKIIANLDTIIEAEDEK